MDDLLRTEFISHYGLRNVTPIVLTQEYIGNFELLDEQGNGRALYLNNASIPMRAINYEAFIDSLPVNFINGRQKCDFIVLSSITFNYFFLNELTNTLQQYTDDFINKAGVNKIGKRNKAISQLLSALGDLTAVPRINTFINRFTDKRCIFFNSQAVQPPSAPLLTAIAAFNRVNTVVSNGFQMYNANIASFNFTLYEYSGSNSCHLS